MRSRRAPTVFTALLAAGLVATLGCSGVDSAATTTSEARSTSTTTTTTTPGVATPQGAARPSPGCSAADAAPAVTGERRTMDVGGTERWYLLTAPAAAADDPVPLLLDLHGLAEGAEMHYRVSGFPELAATEGFVVAEPQGSGQMSAWDIRPDSPDMAYIDALVARIGEERCIDTSRVYSTGLSNGALMSSALACHRSEVFAAVAPVAGVNFPPDCAPERKVPVVAFHGTADPILKFNGGVAGDVLAGALSGQAVSTTAPPPPDLDGPGYPAAITSWAKANGCTQPTDAEVTEAVVHRVWKCPDGGETEFWVVVGGGHTWPGSSAMTPEAIAKFVGPTTDDISATKEAWTFLSRQRLG